MKEEIFGSQQCHPNCSTFMISGSDSGNKIQLAAINFAGNESKLSTLSQPAIALSLPYRFVPKIVDY